MGVHPVDAGVHRLSHAHAHSTDWTSTIDKLWVREDDGWVLIQPIPVDGDLNPVENLRLDPTYEFNPSANSVFVVWDLPGQPFEPNEIWTRVSQLTSIWSVHAYPTTSWSHLNLASLTTYTLDVMVVRRTGLDTVESAVRSISFTTSVFLPTATGDPGPGGSTKLSLPPTVPSGNPGPVSSPTLCWKQVRLQEWSHERWVTRTDTQLSGTTTTWTPSLIGTTAGNALRMGVREVCPGPVYGEWVDTPSFVAPTNWSDPCNTGDTDAAWGVAPYDTALFLLPRFCAPDTVEDVINGVDFTHGPLHAGPVAGPFMFALAAAINAAGRNHQQWDLVEYGTIPGLADMGPDGSLAMWIWLDTDMTSRRPVLTIGGNMGIGVFGGVLGNQPYVFYEPDHLTSFRADGTTAFRSETWVCISADFDSVANEMRLFLNGEEVANEPFDTTVALDTTDVRISLGAGSRVAYLAGWDRSITTTEHINLFANPAYDSGIDRTIASTLPDHFWVFGYSVFWYNSPFDLQVLAKSPDHYWSMHDLESR